MPAFSHERRCKRAFGGHRRRGCGPTGAEDEIGPRFELPGSLRDEADCAPCRAALPEGENDARP